MDFIKNFIRLTATGLYPNMLKIFAGDGRLTSREMSGRILKGKVSKPKTVDAEACIGCDACKNICPTKAITMKPIDEPEELIHGYFKKGIPYIDASKCVYCMYCHDVCPVFSMFGRRSAIHPQAVVEVGIKAKDLMKESRNLPHDKVRELMALLERSVHKEKTN